MNIGEETELVEFIKTTGEIKAACASIVAMLNRHGHGTLYFGVLDNGDVIGQSISKQTKRDIVNTIGQMITPQPEFGIQCLTTPDGKSFIEVDFSGDNAPYAYAGRYYLRVDENDKVMDRDTLADYFAKRIKDYSAWENEDSGYGPDDVKEETFSYFYEKAKQTGRIKIKDSSQKMLLSKLSLLCSNGNLNNAGHVLFGKDGPVLLKLVTFASESRLNILDMEQYNGNVFEDIEKGISYVAGHIDWRVAFDGSPARENIPEIPMEAVREIIVNAFAHGRYRANTNFEIEIYRDRVSIYSPGPFPRGALPEQFAFEGREPIYMNPKIVNILYRGDQIETLASGFERAFTLCKQAGVSYDYKLLDDGFRFVFYRNKEKSTTTLTSRQQKLLEDLKNQPTLTMAELAKDLGVSEKTISRELTVLKEKGLIERAGSSFHGYWKVKN